MEYNNVWGGLLLRFAGILFSNKNVQIRNPNFIRFFKDMLDSNDRLVAFVTYPINILSVFSRLNRQDNQTK